MLSGAYIAEMTEFAIKNLLLLVKKSGITYNNDKDLQ